MSGGRAPWSIMVWLIGAIAVATSPARAQTFDVKQPDVTKGAIDYGPETMFARGLPDGASLHANEQAIFYGLQDWWKINGALKFDKPGGEELRMIGASVGNIFVLKPLDDKRTHDVGLGWFTEITGSNHRESTNSVVFGFIPTLKADKLSLTANPFFEKTFGRNREEGIAFTYGWQVKYELREGLGLGVEGFGVIDDIGNAPRVSEQEHRVGPVFYTELDLGGERKLGADFGVLFGLTPETPDVAVKANFNIPLYKPASRGR